MISEDRVNRTLFGVLWLAGAVAQAQQGPTLGVVFDGGAGAFRRIIGLPGAAHFSAPLDAGTTFSSAVVSPGHEFALGIGSSDSQLYLIRLKGAPVSTPVGGAAWVPSKIIFSPAGRTAVLVGPSGTIQLAIGLPDSPSISVEIDISSLGAGLQAIAISDGGTVLAAFAAADGSSLLYAIGATSGTQSVGSAALASAISFLRNSNSALVADRAAHQILQYQLADSGAAVSVIATQTDGISDPVAVNVSGSAQWVLVGNAVDQSLVRIDLTGLNAPSLFSWGGGVAAIGPLGGHAVFQLGGLSDQPLWVFDGDDVNPRVVFIPAITAPDASGGGQ